MFVYKAGFRGFKEGSFQFRSVSFFWPNFNCAFSDVRAAVPNLLEVHNNVKNLMNIPLLNSQGRNLDRSVTSARTFGLSSIQGDLGESG